MVGEGCRLDGRFVGIFKYSGRHLVAAGLPKEGANDTRCHRSTLRDHVGCAPLLLVELIPVAFLLHELFWTSYFAIWVLVMVQVWFSYLIRLPITVPQRLFVLKADETRHHVFWYTLQSLQLMQRDLGAEVNVSPHDLL